MIENNDAPKFKKHIFICTSCSHDDHPEDNFALELRKELKARCLEHFTKKEVRVNAAGCLGICQEGVHAVIYPDNKWFKKMDFSHIPEIIEYIKSNT